MQRIFGDQQGQSWLLYLDDIVVFSSSVEQHLQRLDAVLGRLQQEGLKARFSKCVLFQPDVLYLGHVISANGVHRSIQDRGCGKMAASQYGL